MDNDDNTGADRNVPSLNRGGQSKLLQQASLAAIILFSIGALYWAATSGSDDDATAESEVVTKEFTQRPAEDRDVPRVTSRPPVQVVEIPQVRTRPVTPPPATRPNPAILEARADENAKRLENERQRQALLASRKAPLLVFNDSQSTSSESETYAEPEPTAFTRAQQNADALNLLQAEQVLRDQERQLIEDEFRDDLRRRELDGSNELFQSRENRFLRDAGASEVETAEATLLQNQEYLITQGTTIAGTLDTAIQSDLSGLLRATASRDVYSRTGDNILIPRASKLVGQYQAGITNGQTRVFIVWTRVERPDGVVIDLGSPGIDTLGRAGLGGQVDTHFFKRFGASFLFSIIGAGVVVAADGAGDSPNTSQVIQDGGDSFQRSAEIALENSIDIPPTIHVDQGAKINIFVAKDLSFKNAMEALQ